MVTLHGMMIWCTHYYDDASYHVMMNMHAYPLWCTLDDARVMMLYDVHVHDDDYDFDVNLMHTPWWYWYDDAHSP